MFMADSWFALRHPEYDRDFERNRPNRHPLKSSSYMNFRNNANAHEFKNGTKKKPKPTTEARRRSKPIFTTEDTKQQSHNHSLPQRTRRNTKRTKTKTYRRGRRAEAIKFAYKTRKFAISNAEATEKSKSRFT